MKPFSKKATYVWVHPQSDDICHFQWLVESKTGTLNKRVGSAQHTADGGAGRSWANQGADIPVGPEGNRPSSPPENHERMLGTSLRKHEQRESYVNRWRNKTSGWQAVYLQDGKRSSLLAVDQRTDSYLSL